MSRHADEAVKAEEIHDLLDSFSKNSYRVKGDPRGDPITDKCICLFWKDYQFSVINNLNGELCGSYPSKLVVLEYEKSSSQVPKERVESIYDVNQMRELFKQGRFARCRSRFVVPVILYEGKHVCRSATLSSGAEMYSRSGLDFLFPGAEQNGPRHQSLERSRYQASDSMLTSRIQSSDSITDQGDMQMFDRIRGQDINILKGFSIKYICDLMVEKKKVKFGLNVTSSEKVDKENRYGEFCIACMPYPGCEFFKDWKDSSYEGERLKFDWSQSFVDACLDIPMTQLLKKLAIDWSTYQKWSLVQLTQNYLKLFIHILKEGDVGLLIHCISGWDRTPMFISLLRLSLWADGAIHKSLSPVEITYLTLAYDWYLFGHNLNDRLNKGEEIMLFCFYFLPYISSEEFSILSNKSSKSRENSSETNSGSCSALGDLIEGRNPQARSSSSSISSLGSGSEPSNTGMFFINSCEEESSIHSANSCPSSRRRNSSGSGFLHVQPSSCQYSSSSPVEVPSSSNGRQPDSGESTTCGSWQVITGTGSFINSYTPQPGPSRGSKDISSESHSSRGSHDNSASSLTGRVNSCEEATEKACNSQRWQKLDSVKRIFNNAYHNKITRKFKPEKGITNLLDQFAEKVGIRPPKMFT